VDGAGDGRLRGWAWNAAQPDERVKVHLRLRSETLTTACADVHRIDLQEAGIGDGRHAFELGIRPEWLEHRAELSVVASAADGTEAGIALWNGRQRGAPADAQHSTLASLAAGQQQLLDIIRDLDARLTTATGEWRDAATRQREAEFSERLDALATWLMRLDEKLGATQPPDPAPSRRGRGQVLLWMVLGAALVGVPAGIALLLPIAAPFLAELR